MKLSPNADRIERYGIYECTIHPTKRAYSNPWEDVEISIFFEGPDGQVFPVDGFYYDTDTWKLRFSPPAVGPWKGEMAFADSDATVTASVSFICESSDRRGFVRRHPTNPFRLVFEDGSLFNAIGIGDCIRAATEGASPLDQWGFDGEFRDKGNGRHRHGWVVDMPFYMKAYGARGAGFNLFRWSIDNCSFKLWDRISSEGNRYLVPEGKWGDELVEALRSHGFRIWLTFFGFHPAYPDAAENPAEQEAVKRYLRYVVARYGAYVDIWELMNEAKVPDQWLTFAADYVRSIDPYRRLITTSWEKPDHPKIELNAPHWYEKESEFVSDLAVSRKIAEAKKWGKPVVFGEQGNSGQNWDEASGLRMRIRSWTAFFEEGVLIFWNSSFAKDYRSGAANVYLGPEERRYIRVLQTFTSRVDSDVERFSLTPTGNQVRGYGLRSSRMVLGYLQHFADHHQPVETSVTVNLPAAGSASWIHPASGEVLQKHDVAAGNVVLTSPEFVVDLAFRVDLREGG